MAIVKTPKKRIARAKFVAEPYCVAGTPL